MENRGSRRAVEGAEGRQGRVIDRGWKGWRYDAPSDVIARYNPLELPAGALSFTSSSLRARPVCCLALIHLILLSSTSATPYSLARSLSLYRLAYAHPSIQPPPAPPHHLRFALLCFALLSSALPRFALTRAFFVRFTQRAASTRSSTLCSLFSSFFPRLFVPTPLARFALCSR